MNSNFSELPQGPRETFIPLYASFKKIYMNGFLCTNLQDTNKFQIIYMNNIYLKTKYLYNYLNTLLYKELIHKNQIGPNKYFVYVVNISCPSEGGYLFFKDAQIDSNFKDIADIVYCFGLLVENSLVIQNSLKIVKRNINFNIYSEKGFFKKTFPYASRKVLNTFRNSENCTSLFRTSQKYVSVLESPKNSYFPLLKDPSFSHIMYSLGFNKSFKNWFKYEIAVSLFYLSKIIIKRGTVNSEFEKLLLLYDKQMNVRYYINNTIDYKMNDSSTVEMSINNSNFSVFDKSYELILHYVRALTCTDLGNKAEYIHSDESFTALYKILNHDINSFLNLLLLYPNLYRVFNQNNTIFYNTPNFSNHELPEVSFDSRGISIQDNCHIKDDTTVNKKILCHNKFIMAERNIYIPKGSSPISWTAHKSFSSRVKNKQNYDITKSGYKSSCAIANEITLPLNHGYSQELTAKRILRSIDKTFFKAINVIGQIDHKFFLCTGYLEDQNNIFTQHLVILDQHAVDERIQLEKLLSRFRDSLEDGYFRTHLMTGELIVFELKNEDMKIVSQFSDYFMRYGLHLKHTSFNLLAVTAIPEFLHWLASRRTSDYAGYSCFVKITITTIIMEQLGSVRETGYITNIIPSVLYKYFCREACLCAINFGIPLTSINCEDIVKELAHCLLPFMCAHGRPVVCFLGELPSCSRLVLPPTVASLTKNIN